MIIVDTCSLVYLSRYYLPFDKGDMLLRFINQEFQKKNLVMLDEILNECRQQSKGLVTKSLPFLMKDKSLILNTSNILPSSPRKFSNLLDNNFCIPIQKRKLSAEEYLEQKQVFLKSGDGKILVYIFNQKDNDLFSADEVIVMTDESRISNDGKVFKKLPVLCDFLDIKTLTLVDYLKMNNIEIDWIVPE